MASLALTLLYIPYIFETIMAYIHLAAFIALLLINIFVQDVEPGNGNRTTISRVLWAGNFFILYISNVCSQSLPFNCRIDWSTKSFMKNNSSLLSNKIYLKDLLLNFNFFLLKVFDEIFDKISNRKNKIIKKIINLLAFFLPLMYKV